MQVEWGKNRMDEEDLQDGEGQKKVWQMNIKKKKKKEMWKLILRWAQTNTFII